MHFPKVLFLDEPTTGLDPQTRANVWDYIHQLQKQKNITIFLTTHYMEEAEICNKVAIIDGGKIVAHDTPHHLKKQYSSTTMRIKSSCQDHLLDYLVENNLKHKLDTDIEHVLVYANKVEDVLKINSLFMESIEDIEINKGTLNDVFIAITGKEIRE